MSELHRFAVVDGSDIEQLIVGLEHRLSVRRDIPQQFTRRLLDTFDWRVHADGSLLEYRTQPGMPDELVWRSLATGETLGRQEVDRPPRFARDLPSGPFRDRLEAVLEMRALAELVTVESIQTVLRLVDTEGKTTARLVIDRSRWNWQDLPVVVEAVPVRGYPGEAEFLVSLLAAQVVLNEGGDDPLLTALSAAGFEAGSYSSKLKIVIDPSASAIDAWVAVLRTLYRTIEVNTDGVLDDTDSEFLHDYRVAVRRTRSVLAQAKGVIPPQVLSRFRSEFAHLGRITGPTRDFDVYLLELPKFEQVLPEERRSHLEPFAKYLDRHQREAHETLVSELGSARVLDALEEWEEWLDSPLVESTLAPDAYRSARDVAASRIWRSYRRLARAGRMITDESPAEDLHNLRKDAKRLRYMLECFGSLFPSEKVTPIVKELKALQDVLGEFQDCEVQSSSIETFGDDLLGEHGAPASTLIAMGYVVEKLDARRRVAREAFTSRFARFDTKAIRTTARELFRPVATTSDKSAEDRAAEYRAAEDRAADNKPAEDEALGPGATDPDLINANGEISDDTTGESDR